MWHYLMTETGFGTTLAFILVCIVAAILVRKAGRR